MGELGDLLRRTREEKGLSLDQVVEAIRIRKEFLQALEEEAFDRLPAAVYVKGFLRNYATFLGLGPQEILSQLPAPEDPEPSTAAAPVAPMLDQPLEPAGLLRFWPFAALLVAVALIITGWWAYPRYSGGLPPFARATATPTATSTATVAPSSPTAVVPTATASPTATRSPTVTPTPARLALSIEVVGQRSWVLVRADAERAFAGILEPGTKDSWTASERIVLRSGNAGSVRVTFNGEDLGLLGEPGQVVEREWTAPGVPTRTPEPSARERRSPPLRHDWPGVGFGS
jgi:cytoskeletal protein RodZ